MSSASNLSQFRIDKNALLIAAIGPFLWIIDSFFSSIFLNESFFKQLIFPGSSALLLRLWLVFFIFLQAWFFNRHSRAKNKVFEIEERLKSMFDLAQDALVVTDIEGRVVEASGKAQELWGYSLQELSDLDLTRLCAAGESERLINFIREIIKNKAGDLDNVMLAVKNSLTVPADFKGRLIDNLDSQDRPGIFLDIARHKGQEPSAAAVVVEPENHPVKAEPEVPPIMPEAERRRIEEAARQEEAKKSQEALKNLEQKYLELMRTRLAEECKKVEDAVRLEEKKKAEERIRQLESAVAQPSDENKLNQQRSQIEEAVREEEAKKYREKAEELENKFNEILKVRLAEARQQAEELAVLEEKRKNEERIREIEAKFAAESGVKISEGRKLIEDAVRQEEQRKVEENALAQRQKYEELLRKGIEDERKRCEESEKLEREKIEAAIRQEERKKAEAQIRELEAKFTADWEEKLQQERKRVEEVVRREEKKSAEEALKAGQQKYEQEIQLRLADERKRIEETLRLEADKRIEEEKKTIGDAVRQLEQKKALEAARAIEKSHAEALAEAAKKVDEQALIKAKELRSLEMGKMVKGLSLQVMIPLAAVLNNIKMMNIKFAQGEDLKVSEVKDAVNAIEENAALVKSILASLSEVSSGSGGSFKPVSLNDPVEKIDALYGKELKMQSITLQKMLLPNLPLVNGDPTLLFLVLFNMVSNAKWAINKDAYRVGGGTITIKTQKSAKEGFVELIISDDGVGISKQNLKQIFEPFFTTKKEGEGLGLGLAIVSEIINAHKGEIHAETQIGSGALFKITLPALASKE